MFMSSEQRRTSSDSGDAYARAVLREERQQEREHQQSEQQELDENNHQKRPELSEADDASDLFRQHSHQQSMEGG